MKARNQSLEGIPLNFEEAFEEVKKYIEKKKTVEMAQVNSNKDEKF